MEIALAAREYLERRSIYLDIRNEHELGSCRCRPVIVEHNKRDRVYVCMYVCVFASMNFELRTANFFRTLATNLEAKSLARRIRIDLFVRPSFLSYGIIFCRSQLDLTAFYILRIAFALNSFIRQCTVFLKF